MCNYVYFDPATGTVTITGTFTTSNTSWNGTWTVGASESADQSEIDDLERLFNLGSGDSH